MRNIILILLFLMSSLCFSQGTARATVSVTIIRLGDSIPAVKEVYLPQPWKKNTVVEKIIISEKDSIRLMKRYIRKKKKFLNNNYETSI